MLIVKQAKNMFFVNHDYSEINHKKENIEEIIIVSLNIKYLSAKFASINHILIALSNQVV